MILKIDHHSQTNQKNIFCSPFKPILYLLFVLLLSSCDGNKADKTSTLTVAVAANVQFAMKAIEQEFEALSKKNINIIIGSSGKLTAQIMQGAPYDLLIAANMKYPNRLHQEGFASNAPKIYAHGSLVLWTMRQDLDLNENLSVLKEEVIRKIGIANPKNAPYGEQAVNALNYYNLSKDVENKLVYAESVAQTNQYITTQNCELGFTAKSVVLAPEIQGKGKWIVINPTAYEPITQGVIITKYGKKNNAALAKEFYDFLFSQTAASIFEQYGYTIPN